MAASPFGGRRAVPGAEADTKRTHHPVHQRSRRLIRLRIEQPHLQRPLALAWSRVPARTSLGTHEGDPGPPAGAV